MTAGGTVALLGPEHPDQFADQALAVERRDGRHGGRARAVLGNREMALTERRYSQLNPYRALILPSNARCATVIK